MRIEWHKGQPLTATEGIGPGLLMTVYAKDKARFDDLLRLYTKLVANKNKFLTYVHVDAAMALLLAGTQWPTNWSRNYTRNAIPLINKISNNWVKKCQAQNILVVQPDDVSERFDPCSSKIAPWYYKPAFFRFFTSVPGVNEKDKWNRLADSSYQVFNMKKVQNKTFVPDTLRLNSNSSVPYSNYSYSCARIPFDVALDYAWHGTAQAKIFAKRLIDDLVLKSNNYTIASIRGSISKTTANSERGNPLPLLGGFASGSIISLDKGTSNDFTTIFRRGALLLDPVLLSDSGGSRHGKAVSGAFGGVTAIRLSGLVEVNDNVMYGRAVSVLSALFITGNFKHPSVLKEDRRSIGNEICRHSREFKFLLSRVRVSRGYSIAEMLNNQPKYKNGYNQLHDLTKNFENIDDKIQNLNKRSFDRRDCELEPRALENAGKFVQYYGFGKMKNAPCVTKFEMTEPDFEEKRCSAPCIRLQCC